MSSHMKEKIARNMGYKIGPSSAKKNPKTKQPRMLTAAEKAEKTKNWPKGSWKEPNEQGKRDYQKRVGRAYND